MMDMVDTKVKELDWRLTYERPKTGSKIIVQSLDGIYYIYGPVSENFGRFGDDMIRWAYV